MEPTQTKVLVSLFLNNLLHGKRFRYYCLAIAPPTDLWQHQPYSVLFTAQHFPLNLDEGEVEPTQLRHEGTLEEAAGVNALL